MKREDILKALKMLAGSQGFYTRIYNTIMSVSPEEQEPIWRKLEAQNFKDTVDMILYFET